MSCFLEIICKSSSFNNLICFRESKDSNLEKSLTSNTSTIGLPPLELTIINTWITPAEILRDALNLIYNQYYHEFGCV